MGENLTSQKLENKALQNVRKMYVLEANQFEIIKIQQKKLEADS